MAERRLQGAGGVPPSAPGLPSGEVRTNQRRLLLAATARALARHGYAELTVAHLLAEAGVSRATFYEHFGSKRECVLVAHEVAFARFAGELFRVCAVEPARLAKAAAAIGMAIGSVVAESEDARLLIVDGLAADPDLVERVLASNDHLAGLLRPGRERGAPVRARPDPRPELVQLMLLPYLGITEARLMAEAA